MTKVVALTMEKRREIYNDFLGEKYPTKAALAQAYCISPRTVNRSIQMVEEVEQEEENTHSDKTLDFPEADDFVQEVEAAQNLQYMISEQSVVIVVDGQPITMSSDHQNYKAIKVALVEERYDDAMSLIDIHKGIDSITRGKIKVEDGKLSYDGYPMDGLMANYILDKLAEGIEPINVFNFMDNLMENPSHRAVTELWGFLRTQQLPITDDGHFLAYKRIRDNYTDSFSGTFDNSVGNICSMPRNQVDEDRDRTCSVGLHFCSKGYVRSFWGERVVVLKINPKDVVSIPVDYNNTKGRTCRYEVVGELDDVDQDLAEFL